MSLSLKPQHLKRYRDIAWLLFKYGRSDLLKAAGLEEVLQDETRLATAVMADAKELADDLEAMGPTFIKLGQLLSTRSDLLPAPYLAALSRLQNDVAAFSFNDVERIVGAELGVRISKAFSEFDSVPIAGASLAQVHRARLRDGRPVAVKVQRPDIRERVAEDLEVLAQIGGFLDAHTDTGARYQLSATLDEFRRSLLRELDYRIEAQNLELLGRNLAEFPRLVVPAPIWDYSTDRVLTMEYMGGTKITALSPVVLLEVDGAALAEEIFRAYLHQVLVDGFFHADPHPGNVILTRDDRLALLDLGMVARITARTRDHLLQLLLAISEGQADEATRFLLALGRTTERFDRTAFARTVAALVAENQDATLQQLQVGRTVLDVMRTSGGSGLRLPPELALLGKALLNLDEIGRRLDPSFDPNACVRRHAARILQRRLLGSLSPGSLARGLMETKALVESLPGRVNTILERLANNDLTVKVDAIDEATLMAAFQKIANRITLGLLLAALIVGAAMLMHIETRFRILGYPGVAIIFFLLAAGGAVALMINILFKDR
jgi:predicted unusual protein kinase regulating ubiquinone biosynthesis (AarF/ABC1/UbiB family)